MFKYNVKQPDDFNSMVLKLQSRD